MWMLGILANVLCIVQSASVLVHTAVGDIYGHVETETIDGRTNKVNFFTSIPYAEAPIGRNRFERPIPKARFSIPYNATKIPPSCYQYKVRVLPRFHVSEDCLYLSVYVPGDMQHERSLPVMIWIHGGSFTAGTSGYYNPHKISLLGNVIVVTINYRLGVFGFLQSSDQKLIGNQGLWDQQLAIKWVYDNIASFHGNKDLVTIFGESAGAGSVVFHMLYQGNHGLFRRGIAESGSPLGYDWYTNSTNGELLVQLSGCDQGNMDPIECLKHKPAATLNKIIDNKLSYTPYLDGDFVIERPYDIVYGNNPLSSKARHLFASTDLLTGVNNKDGGLDINALTELLNQSDAEHLKVTRDLFIHKIIPRAAQILQPKTKNIAKTIEKALTLEYTDWSDPTNTVKLRDSSLGIFSDWKFCEGAIKTVEGHSKFNASSTYFYEFAAKPPAHILKTPTWLHGSNHADDIAYVFGMPLEPPSPSFKNATKYDVDLSRAMITMWTNFAKSGNPNKPVRVQSSKTDYWEKYNSSSQRYLKMSNWKHTARRKKYFKASKMVFWIKFIPEILNQTSTQTFI